ncbi:hypothetical protein [Aquirufa rosea]|uniref:DUF5672 domain-containing protein n=1 Tax=Aquirufa rosea TaxID=2509241 RepID=A0A4Q1BY62_9BACT|nr:hypothetical protein [Aquirufa rosea]RXK47605.1 hypothetical protein ESB04_10220 [Aquirufa rosea]
MKFQQVDVAVNVYGKPYQTAVSIWSLMKNSGQHIQRIYVTLEKSQPEGFDEELLKSLLDGLPITYFKPKFFFGWWEGRRKGLLNKILLYFKDYRYSIRSQYPWENCQSKYLFMMHNDMLFNGDLIGHYLSKIGDSVGIGQVGQCWNCPAFVGHCDGDRYWDFRPTMAELKKLYESKPDGRAVMHGLVEEGKMSWPLPECRLNEHAALINLDIARPVTSPRGPVAPIGLKNSLDNGIPWFQGMTLKGFKMVNESYMPFAKHAWTNDTDCGHASLFDRNLYDREEKMAEFELAKWRNN